MATWLEKLGTGQNPWLDDVPVKPEQIDYEGIMMDFAKEITENSIDINESLPLTEEEGEAVKKGIDAYIMGVDPYWDEKKVEHKDGVIITTERKYDGKSMLERVTFEGKGVTDPDSHEDLLKMVYEKKPLTETFLGMNIETKKYLNMEYQPENYEYVTFRKDLTLKEAEKMFNGVNKELDHANWLKEQFKLQSFENMQRFEYADRTIANIESKLPDTTKMLWWLAALWKIIRAVIEIIADYKANFPKKLQTNP